MVNFKIAWLDENKNHDMMEEVNNNGENKDAANTLIYVNVGGITDLANQWKYMEG